MNPRVPISSQELKDLRADVKRLDTIVAGLIAQAESDEGRVTPASEPTARPARIR
jgi:hypothetical protein